ncbi:amidohydrolase [Sporolactobacillus vineae]|uniref:amidohydrolase n=1 Tax=Sporolactobacillus vineae TaxID=444463 RepID=UPI00028822B1|nr:amidohydrolase [Sporolactobacillus vineae]
MTIKETDSLDEMLIERRRELHRHPELAFEEKETTAKLKSWLTAASVTLADLPLETGVLGVIGGKKPGPVIALRTDIDALPIAEQTGLPFASEVPGKMHACGHDLHMTSMLGAALLLKERENELNGTVKIIFQPAEEIGEGARRVLETHLLDDAQAICGMHIMPGLPVGTVGIKSGPLMAGVDHFIIDLNGKGTHGAVPEQGDDLIVVSAQIISALQSIVSRNLSPLDQAVISTTRITAGNTWNVMPDHAQLEGTVRTFTEQTRGKIEQRMNELVTRIAGAFSVSGKVHYLRQGPPIVNNPQLADLAEEAARATGLKVVDPEPTTIGEDFAYYQKQMSSLFVFMGVSGNSGLHHADLVVDERAIGKSARFFAALAEQLLNKTE